VELSEKNPLFLKAPDLPENLENFKNLIGFELTETNVVKYFDRET
jgi:hypothetical protein